MSTKRAISKLLLLLLTFCILLTAVACKKDDEKQPTNNGDDTTDISDVQLAFPKTDYKSEFTVLYPEWGMYKDFFFAKEGQEGETVASEIFNRANLVYDYLGVDVIGMPVASAGGTQEIYRIAPIVSTAVQAQTDSYQLVLTHTYGSVSTLVGGNYLLDFYDFDNINLEADYWNKQALEELEVQGSAYLALSEYMLADPNAVFFNKQMLQDYEQLESPYKLVEDGRWTYEMMFQMASQVDFDNESLENPLDGTYGFGAMADWQFISFIDSCDVDWIVDDGGYLALNMGTANERYVNVVDTVTEMIKQDWTYLYSYQEGNDITKKLDITQGKTLFTIDALHSAYGYRESEVKFGILPYPKYDTEQKEYQSFNWSGMMCVPRSVKNQEMVEKTLEALAYFSVETTTVAYYEKLLGARLSEAPEDKAMLDVIFDGIVLNKVINFALEPELNSLVYTIAFMAMEIDATGSATTSVMGNWNKYNINGAGPAQALFDEYFN